MSLEYISIWRRPMTLTEPGSHTRLLSLRSTSEHMVSSDSSFLEFRSFRICSESEIASSPRLIVPEIGQVSTRRPLTRTNISGDAPIRYSRSPRLMKKESGDGLMDFSLREISDGWVSQRS